MSELEKRYYDGMFGARHPGFTTQQAEGVGEVKEIERTKMQQAIGTMGAWIQSLAEQLDKYGVTIRIPGTDAELNPTLKDVTVGDLGKVLEDISFGFYPTKGAGMTTQLKPEAAELLNLPVLGAPVVAAGKVVAKGAGKAAAKAAAAGAK